MITPQSQPGEEISLVAELARMKVLFQARAIAAAIGAPQPTALPDQHDSPPEAA